MVDGDGVAAVLGLVEGQHVADGDVGGGGGGQGAVGGDVDLHALVRQVLGGLGAGDVEVHVDGRVVGRLLGALGEGVERHAQRAVVGYGGDLGYLERVVLGGLFGGVGLIGRLAPGGVVGDGGLLALSGIGGGGRVVFAGGAGAQQAQAKYQRQGKGCKLHVLFYGVSSLSICERLVRTRGLRPVVEILALGYELFTNKVLKNARAHFRFI